MNPEERYQSIEDLQKQLKNLNDWEDFNRKLPQNVMECSFEKVKENPKIQGKRKERPAIWDFAPPGFRTRKLWKMIVAVFGYAVVLFLTGGLEVTNTKTKIPVTGINLLIERISVALWLLGWIALLGNYMQVQERLPVIKILKKKGRDDDKSKYIYLLLRYSLLALYGVIWMVCVILMAAMAESL